MAAVHREASQRARITAEDESRTGDDRFLVLQPSLDQSWWRVWGGFHGYAGALVEKTLTGLADDLPAFPDGTRGNSSWRRATALVGLCLSDDPAPAQVTVFTGPAWEAGPQVRAQ